MKRRTSIGIVAACLACVAALALAGCAANPEEPAQNTATEMGDVSDSQATDGAALPQPGDMTKPTEDPIADLVASMTLEQKVAQLFMVRPESITGVDTVTVAGSITQEALQKYPVGGIVYFTKNLQNPQQTADMLANSQAYSQQAIGLPLFTGVDEEGGTVSRIGGNPGFGIPNAGDMSDVGATGDTEQAQAVAQNIGGYLKDLGFNVDFAPDSDICGDPATDVMARRSFGTDPNLVASMVEAQVKGFSAAGVLCSAKHFPGIGGVIGDSETQQITSEKTLDQLESWEVVPFKAAIAADVPFIMVGHLSTPAITGDSTPASINPLIITDLLRNTLGYQNIIITDSMEMGAIGGFVTADQVGVAALQAGADMVLMPDDFYAAYQGVLDAVSNETLSEDRIDQSVYRIVKTKTQRLAS